MKKKKAKNVIISFPSVLLVSLFIVSVPAIAAEGINIANIESAKKETQGAANSMASCKTWEEASKEMNELKEKAGYTLNGYQIVKSDGTIVASSYSTNGQGGYDVFSSKWNVGNKIELDVAKDFSETTALWDFFSDEMLLSTPDKAKGVSMMKTGISFSCFATII
jgi:hypothetical protein